MSLTASPPRQQIVDRINSYLQTNGSITAAEHKEIELLLVDAIYGAQIGDIKEIACDNTYITNNFKIGTTLLDEGLGLSTGERYGWAICNGKNGTINKMGRVAIGYDPINYSIGSVGGTKTHTLLVTEMPPHGHKFGPLFRNDNLADNNMPPRGSNAPVTGYAQTNVTGGVGSGNFENTTINPTTAPHNNMQPYIVTLFIQRISV
jgi:hypothetical protein